VEQPYRKQGRPRLDERNVAQKPKALTAKESIDRNIARGNTYIHQTYVPNYVIDEVMLFVAQRRLSTRNQGIQQILIEWADEQIAKRNSQ
jgi:hypothetical protein